MSVWHSPEATMRTVTCPGPGSGTGRSSITSGWPNWRTTAAFIAPPRSFESPGQAGRRRTGEVRGVGHADRGPKVPDGRVRNHRVDCGRAGVLAPAPDHPAAEMFPTAAAKAGANA